MNTLIAGTILVLCAAPATEEEEVPPHVGSRLEMFVDEALIDSMTGQVRLQMHRPERREVVLRTDAPWEGNASAFQSVFKDGDLYRMYYRGLHYRHSGESAQAMEDHPWLLCYAESDDGVDWRKPELGLFEFNGSKANNIILTPEFLEGIGGDPAHTATFKDSNPDCPADQRYKIVIVGHKPRGLYVLASGDGIRFTPMSDKPSVTKGAFDSQNLMFWDPVRCEYREYHRSFADGVRGIMTASSKDVLHFPEPVWLEFPGAAKEHLYTNQVQPYYRAPHILMGFPMRYSDRGWSESTLNLPELGERLVRAESSRRYGTAVTDALFMTSRDGRVFKRWPEAFIRPGPARKDTWTYGDNFVFWGMVETASQLPCAPNDISLYASEGYWRGTHTSVRRYTIRIDGFVSAHATAAGGEIVTKPLVFEGGNLTLNLATSGAGSVQVEIQDADGRQIKGYTLRDCPEIYGDDIRYTVRWKETGGDVRPLAGRPVRLRFVLRDADLYAFQFVPHEPDPERPDLVRYGGMPKRSIGRGPYVVIDDDFASAEADTSGVDADLDPIARGKPWLISEGQPDRVQVLNDDPPGSGKPGPSNHLRVERHDEHAQQGGRAWIKFSPQDAVDTEDGIVEIESRIFLPSTGKCHVDVDAFDNVPNYYTDRAFHVRFFPNGKVCYYREKDTPIEGLAIQTDVWQDVVIRADMREATFDLTVAGRSAKGLPFARDDVHRIQTIVLCPNRSNGVMYVDHIRVRVTPEADT
jgi:hypothetical protein